MTDLKAGVATSFNGGEIAPYLAGRVDHEGFAKCTRKLLNGIPEIGGGIKKFYGTEFVSALPMAKNFALIPFHHEDGVFLMVLHNGKLDAIVDDQFVALNIPLPTISDYQMIRYEQANDVLICCCAECAPFKIEYYGAGSNMDALFGLKQVEFEEVPYFPLGYTGNYSGQLEISGVSSTVIARIPAALQKNALKISYPEALAKSSFNVSGRIYRGFRTVQNEQYLTTPSMGDIVLSLRKTKGGVATNLFSIVVNSFSEGRIELPESARDDLWVRGYGYTHYLYWRSNSFSYSSFLNALLSKFPDSLHIQPDIYVPTEDIEGYEDGSVYEFFVEFKASSSVTSEDPLVLSHGKGFMSSYGITTSSQAKSYASSCDTTVAAALFSDLNNLVGRKLKIYQNASDSPIAAWYQGMTVKANETIVWSDGKYYLAKSGSTTKSVQPTHTEGVVSDGGVEWLYLHSGYITATIASVKDEYEMTLLLEPGVSVPVSDLSKTTNYFSMYRWSIWGADAIYPSEVFFNNGRLGFFINTKFGTYYSLSRSDSYYDFSEDTDGEVLDTDSIQGLVTGGSFSNKINWVISRENIYCGSYGTEFVIRGLDGLMTPSSTVCKPVSFTGGDKVAALKYMTLSMFVGAGGDNLNVVNYDYSTETYEPTDVSYIAGHLLKGKVKKVTGAPRPDNCIYMVTRDGSVVQLVDSVSEKVTAFSGTSLGDNVLDAASVFCENDTEVYIARAVGEEVHIEKFSISSPTYMLSTRHYKTASKSFVEPVFANSDVYVKNVSNGQFYKTYVDNDGVVINDFVGSDIMVGFPMPFEVHGVPSVGRKLEGSKQKSVRFLVRLLNSGAFSYGSSHDFDKWYDYNNWNIADGQAWDSSHKLMTGDIQLPASFGYMQGQNTADGPYPNDTSVALNVFSDTPEPFNLLMVSNIYV